jgi:hypothetical protein
MGYLPKEVMIFFHPNVKSNYIVETDSLVDKIEPTLNIHIRIYSYITYVHSVYNIIECESLSDNDAGRDVIIRTILDYEEYHLLGYDAM